MKTPISTLSLLTLLTIVTSFTFLTPLTSSPQIVYQDLTNQNIYTFIDELANKGIIRLTSVIKPYSREFIAKALREASSAGKREKLSKRQQKELDFYLRDFNLELRDTIGWINKNSFFKNKNYFRLPFNPLEFVYKDSLFTFVVRPVLGVSGVYNENGYVYHRWNGAEIFGYVGKHFGYYASLRDNHENKWLTAPGMINQEEGAVWKPYPEGAGDYSEMRGGMTWKWRWGDLTFVKDHIQWGDHNHGSIIQSGRTPSFPYLQFHITPLKWLEFTWLQAWLVSEVPDTTKTYTLPTGAKRVTYFNKYYAMSMFTFKPIGGLDLSIGNSVVYCADYMNPAYLSPFLFYWDYGYAEGDGKSGFYGKEVQTFLNVSSRNIRHLHLFGSLFITSAGIDGLSYKLGLTLSDLPLKNISVKAEFTRNNSKAYYAGLPTTTYASNQYSMGSYLFNNSEEAWGQILWKPLRGLHFTASYTWAQHAAPGSSLSDYDFKDNMLEITARYELINNAYIWAGYQNRHLSGDVRYYPAIYAGNTNSIVGGINIGF
jgi:hypothetical protein